MLEGPRDAGGHHQLMMRTAMTDRGALDLLYRRTSMGWH
jgi:hypothetical protein